MIASHKLPAPGLLRLAKHAERIRTSHLPDSGRARAKARDALGNESLAPFRKALAALPYAFPQFLYVVAVVRQHDCDANGVCDVDHALSDGLVRLAHGILAPEPYRQPLLIFVD